MYLDVGVKFINTTDSLTDKTRIVELTSDNC